MEEKKQKIEQTAAKAQNAAEERNAEAAKTLFYAADARQPKGSIVICPGGGYRFLSPREAAPVAAMFTKAGWNAYVLSYTVNASEAPENRPGRKVLLETADAVAAAKAALPEKPVILCGFSAGGHVAAMLGVHWDDAALFPEKARQTAVRPDGLILCYPVISAGEYAHKGSFRNLTEPAEYAYYSAELHVKETTPPTFLWHTAADEQVPVQNSLLFANALAEKHVPFELHIYPYGVHGLSLATKEVEEPEKNRLADPHVAGWAQACIAWLNLMFPVK